MGDRKPVRLTDSNFEVEVLQSDKPVLVDFWAEWCAPCRGLAPVIDALAADYDGRVKVGKLDVEAHQDLAASFKITSIPAVLVFVDGEVVEALVGAQAKSNYEAVLDKLVTPEGAESCGT